MKRQAFTAEQRAEYKAAKREESRELIESAARELLTSEGWQRFAEVRGSFHRYSFGNCMLIAMQRPDATRVAGFHKWQDLGRQVRKGEHGIRILAPHTYKGTDDNGEEETRVYFRAVSVFDLSQTDGEPLPEIRCEPLTGDSHAGCCRGSSSSLRRSAGLSRLARLATPMAGRCRRNSGSGSPIGWTNRTGAFVPSFTSSFTRWASAMPTTGAKWRKS